MKKLSFILVLLTVLISLTSCSQVNPDVATNEPGLAQAYADAVLGGAAISASGQKNVDALEAEAIAYGLQDADKSNDDFLRMVQDLGGYSAFDDLMFTLSDKEAEALLAKYGIGFSNTYPSPKNSNAELTTQDIKDCDEYFPPSDRNKVLRVTAPLEKPFFVITKSTTLVVIDSSGRPSRATQQGSGLLSFNPTKRDTGCQNKVGKFGVPDDQGGHMVAAQLGGYNRRANLVPQNGNFNQGVWSRVENDVRNCVDKTNSAIHRYGGGVLYPNSTTLRPNRFVASYRVSRTQISGTFVSEFVDFANAVGGGSKGVADAAEFRVKVGRTCR